ncbi:hypothetical protein [Microbispora sp. H10670]|uniref:hypothetical protein n=1 Tax=Microbispora sp. H10670 TaxID=2729108 RepID=UPI0016026F2A|nr:hypothetical protein [Microbispora sp. H10670]
MTGQPPADRFDYTANLARATTYGDHRNAFWPPSDRYELRRLDLADAAPALGPAFLRDLAALGAAVEDEWRTVKTVGAPARTRLPDPLPVAEAMRRIGGHLPGEVDRRALALRADAVQHGYTDDILQELVGVEEDVAVVAGQISTWYGKDLRGLPTAFACRRDPDRQADVSEALTYQEDVAKYLARLHADLRLGDVPAFAATRLFFMAGEGALHPKHIAYFLPEDEGVKRSPFKKTYYFGNTHRAMVEGFSAPLAARHLDLGEPYEPGGERFARIPALGVFGHELGHSVRRPATAYKELNAADRWASVVLQEVAADVFGILILADVWAPRMDLSGADAVAYYLGECLRYVDRGLGHFPDSDGMFLQLSYFVQLGALALEDGRLKGDPEVVLAGLRSLARVLADALLAGRGEPAVALYGAYGPANPAPLLPLIEEMRSRPLRSVDYLQEHLHAHGDA